MSRNKRRERGASGQSLVPAPTNNDGIWHDIDKNVVLKGTLEDLHVCNSVSSPCGRFQSDCTAPVVDTSCLFWDGFCSFMAFTVWSLFWLGNTAEHLLPYSAAEPFGRQDASHATWMCGEQCGGLWEVWFFPRLSHIQPSSSYLLTKADFAAFVAFRLEITTKGSMTRH